MNNKFRNLWVAMYGIATLSVALVSCSSSDDFQSQVSIADSEVSTNGIQSEIDGLYTTFKVKSNDKWTIEVPQDAKKWVYLPVKSGEGDADVPVSIDTNYGSTTGRTTTLTIKTSNGTTQTVKITQSPTYNGESVAANGTDYAQQIAIASCKGIGLGLNLTDLSLMTDRVINLYAVKQLMKEDSVIHRGLFTYDARNAAQADGTVCDSILTKRDSLGVDAGFDINYGRFKLHIKADYNGNEQYKAEKNEYRYGASYNIASSSVDMGSIVAEYNKAKANTADTRNCLLAPGFIDAKQEFEDAVASGDEKSIQSAADELVGSYGLVVVSGCNLGSSLALWMKYNHTFIKESLNLDSAKVATAIKAGLFQLDLGVQVGYVKESTEILENSAFQYNIAGGSKSTIDAVSAALSVERKSGDEGTVYSGVKTKISDWINSLDANDPKTLTCTKFSIKPIWQFFKGDARRKLKEYITTNCTSKDKLGVMNSSAVKNDAEL